MLIEERAQDLLPEVRGGVAAESQGSQSAAVVNGLAVVPRTQDEEDLVVGRVLGFEAR